MTNQRGGAGAVAAFCAEAVEALGEAAVGQEGFFLGGELAVIRLRISDLGLRIEGRSEGVDSLCTRGYGVGRRAAELVSPARTSLLARINMSCPSFLGKQCAG
jgi:hypothetical protein